MRERQPEVDERRDSILVEGDDRDHVLPPSELDPYTPEPQPATKARVGIWLALLTLAIVVGIIVYAALA
jgi:hypothetical protein